MPVELSSRKLAGPRELRLVHGVRRPAVRGGTKASGLRVLIADGQALVRAGLRMLLEADRRISVIAEAGTGEEAVALARETRPDVVLVEERLPGLDWAEIAHLISAGPGPPWCS
jgi:AmiR/NasT family two-component response regulator